MIPGLFLSVQDVHDAVQDKIYHHGQAKALRCNGFALGVHDVHDTFIFLIFLSTM